MASAARGIPRLFVANISWTIGSRELREYFSQYGMVNSAMVVFDKVTGLSRGYGFVQFATRDGFVTATSKTNHVLEGNTMTVQQAADSSTNSV